MALLQEFVDSGLGTAMASALHTLGAVAFVGGMAAFLGWTRGLRAGHPNGSLRLGAAFTTYLAIVANLVGGFMRLYRSGHPPLTDFAHEPWVQLMAVKHVALFIAMGAAVVLFQGVAPRLLRACHEGRLPGPVPADQRIAVSLVVFGVVMAGVLGAASLVTPLEHVAADEDMDAGPEDPGPLPAFHAVRYHNATGQLTSTALTPRTVTGAFDVVNGTGNLQAALLWDQADFTLELLLFGPDGQPAGAPEAASGRIGLSVDGPSAGAWRYEIRADLAFDVAWDLSVRLAPEAGDETLMADTLTIAPGNFFEINTQMPRNGTIAWDWSIREGDDVAFNLHSHFDDEVQYLVEETTDAHHGAYTNDREGGYSLMWENTGSTPLTLRYRAWGDYTLDSCFPAC